MLVNDYSSEGYYSQTVDVPHFIRVYLESFGSVDFTPYYDTLDCMLYAFFHTRNDINETIKKKTMLTYFFTEWDLGVQQIFESLEENIKNLTDEEEITFAQSDYNESYIAYTNLFSAINSNEGYLDRLWNGLLKLEQQIYFKSEFHSIHYLYDDLTRMVLELRRCEDE